MNPRIKHLDSIDYIRGIAIIAVLVFHLFLYTFGGDHDGLPWRGWVRSFSVPEPFLWFLPFSIGNCGVPIFFVVSGFCIHLSFHQQGKEWRAFFIRRFFRIYPAYLAALVFSVLLIYGTYFQLALHTKGFWTQVLTHLFFVHNVNPTTFTGLNGPFWSLAIETQLYLLYPVLLIVAGKIGWRRTMPVLAAAELLIRGFAGVVDTWVSPDAIVGFWGNASWLISHSPFGFWFSWALGAYIADAFLNGKPLPFAGISAFWPLALAVASYFFRPLFPFQFLLFSLTTACTTTKLLTGAGPRGESTVVLKSLKKIGVWSYSIYLLHMPLLSISGFVLGSLIPAEYLFPATSFLMLALALLLMIPFCVLWHHVFELPGSALGKRFIRKMEKPQTAITATRPEILHPLRNVTSRYVLMSCTAIAFAAITFWAHEKFTPPRPEDYYNRGLTLVQKGKLDEAIDQFREAIRIKPEFAIAHRLLGNTLGANGRFEEAIEQFREAIRFDTNNVETHFNLGVALAENEQFQEAASEVLQALRINPDLAKSESFLGFIGGLNNRAWSLATSADTQARNGTMAVKLGRLACDVTQYRETIIVGTLAAAYAEAGQFEDAISTAQKACDLAEKNGQTDLLQKNRELLASYQNHQAYHEGR